MNKSVFLKICSLMLVLVMCLLTVTGCDGTATVTSSTTGDTSSTVSDTSSDTTSSDTASEDDSNSSGSTETLTDPESGETVTVTTTKSVAFDASKNPLKRGINFSTFENDQEVGYDNWIFQGEYYDAVREKGFDHIRLPVDFFKHMGNAPDYIIDEEFLCKIDTVINTALSANLRIVLDFHHFGELQTNCAGNKQKFYAMWEQLAEHYQSYPSGLVFELINEPGNASALSKGGPDLFTPAKILEIQEEAIKIIRKTNPTRLIVHATRWNDGAAQLMDTEPLLPDDENLIMSVHSYEPMGFTHQGADWNNDGIDNGYAGGIAFTEDMKYEIELVFAMVKNYQEKYGRPVWIGEFGALHPNTPAGERAKYAEFLIETMKDAKCGWCWWEFYSGFGVYNLNSNQWMNDGVIDALMK